MLTMYLTPARCLSFNEIHFSHIVLIESATLLIMVLKLQQPSESSEAPIKHHTLNHAPSLLPPSTASDSGDLGWDPRICISNNFPDDQRTILGESVL